MKNANPLTLAFIDAVNAETLKAEFDRRVQKLPKRLQRSHKALQLIRSIREFADTSIFNDRRANSNRRYKLIITRFYDLKKSSRISDTLNEAFRALDIKAVAYPNPRKSEYTRTNWFGTVCISTFN